MDVNGGKYMSHNHPKGIKGEPHEEELVQDYVSRLYPKRYSGTGFLYHARIVTEMLDGLKFRDGRHSDKVLDVGCGIGFVSQLYPNFDITGIDISEGMLSHNPYKWIKAPAESIPFPDNTFDFVVCRSLLHHLEVPSDGLREMVRVLKPGGKWVCWDPNYNLLSESFRAVARLTPRFSHIHKNFKDKDLYRMIEESGLKITSKKYIGFLAYPLIGFPDIMNLNLPIWFGRTLMAIDDFIGKTPFKGMAWSLMVKAEKK